MNKGTGMYVHMQPFNDLQIGDTFGDVDFGPMIWNGEKWQSDFGNVQDPQIGDLVHYTPYEGCNDSEMKNGRIKSLGEIPRHVFVVYNCNDDWENYANYTAALTPIEKLKSGWTNKDK